MDNDIDLLWSRIAEDPTQVKPADIDGVIEYYRSLRASKASGVKPRKDTGPKKKIDLAALGLPSKEAAAVVPSDFKRRV